MSIPVLSIVGKSNSGKTTLLEKLIPELKRRGLRLATIKHHSHPGFEIDQPGKDTWRHAQAGSDLVILAAPDKIATIRRLEQEWSLDEIIAQIADVDLILTEGYKRAGKHCIEVFDSSLGQDLISQPPQRIAIATDRPLETEPPQFSRDDIIAIADFIITHLL